MVTSRIWFTAAQKAELWERWKNGQSAAAISRALERKNKTGVERIVVLQGGIAPAPRHGSMACLPSSPQPSPLVPVGLYFLPHQSKMPPMRPPVSNAFFCFASRLS
jgi:hypothetical protein